MLKACIGLNCTRQIDFVDRRHCNLTVVPDDTYRHERTLEELLLDYNALQELPPKFFRLTNLRKLTISENDINRIPPGIANLTRLVELDISKNALEEIPQNIQFCRSLSILDVSSNPLLRTPEAISSIASLTQLGLNDVAITRLPLDIGNIKNLIVLEARENALKTLPPSIGYLKKLRRLDVGNNEIEFLPPEIGELEELTELWLDSNCLGELPESVSNLKNLTILDVTKNKLERLPVDVAKLSELSDLHASENCIDILPDNLGDLHSLTLIKLDFNQLTEIPASIGRLHRVTELLLFDNMLESIPASLFEMKSLEMLNLDRNHLIEIPTTVGLCKSLHVLSLRENELVELPEEVGQLEELTVLDVVGNRLSYLPLTLSTLKLDALWIDGSQPQPLVALHPEPYPENPERKRLTCTFLTQQENFLECGESFSEEQSGSLSRTGSFGRSNRLGVAFDPSVGPADADQSSKIVRFPTPFRKDMKAMKAKRRKGTRFKPDATPSTTIFKKGSSQDDLNIFSTSVESRATDTSLGDLKEIMDQFTPSPNLVSGSVQNGEVLPSQPSPSTPYALNIAPQEEMETDENSLKGGLTKMSSVDDLTEGERTGSPSGVDLVQGTTIIPGMMEDSTPDLLKNAVYATETTEIPGSSQLQTIEVVVDLKKVPGRTLGFSIAGGRGSTPAYEDVDESIFVTKIASGGLAEQDGRLRLGDKLLLVNDRDMVNSTHAEAVAALKSITDACRMVVSREVLVVMPEDAPLDSDESKLASPPALPTPKAKLTYDQGSSDRETGSPEPSPAQPMETTEEDREEEKEKDGEGESFAKKIVAEILGRSVNRTKEEERKEAGETKEEEEEEEGDGKSSPHVDYVNYDIAQNVLESTAMSGSISPVEPIHEDEESPLPQEEVEPSPEPERPSPPRLTVHEPSPSVGSTYSYGEFPEERVLLDRTIGLLGLSIVGGADHASRVFGNGKPGVYISKITRGGAAHATGKLRLGDRILEVNGNSTRRATHQEAVRMLVSQHGNIELLVQHIPQPPGLQELVIEKEAKVKLGISIRGGAKGSKGNPLDPEDEGIFVSKISQGGAAEQDGRLHVGHRLIEVNGTSLLGASHLEAVKALRSAPSKFTIIICQGYEPREVLWRKSQQERDFLSYPLDDMVHRLLSESLDAIPQRTQSNYDRRFTLPAYTVPRIKQSQSSSEIADRPVTAEDLDEVLKGLAKFKELAEPKPEPLLDVLMTSTPSSAPPTLARGSHTEGVTLLENGLELFGEDVPDIPPFIEDLHHEESERPPQEEQPMIPSLEQELSSVQIEDTNLVLAALDDEVSHLQDEVSKQEVELLESEKKPEPKKVTPPKPKQPIPKIKVNVEPPADEKVEPPADEKAIQSMMGEVFDDVTFEEFEEESIPSGTHSGFLTPTTEALRAMSPDPNPPANFQELLSALQGLGEEAEEQPKETDAAVIAPRESVRKAAVVSAAPVPKVSFRAEKKDDKVVQSSLTVAPRGSPVLLRASTGRKDQNKRKSAPPIISNDSDSGFGSPEKLTFREKLKLHQMVSEDSAPKPPERPQSAKDQNRLKQQNKESDISLKRTFSDGTAGSSRLSAEERRLAKAISPKTSIGTNQSQPPSDHDSKQTETEPQTQSPTKQQQPSSQSPTLNLRQQSTHADAVDRTPKVLIESSVDPEYDTPVDAPPQGGSSNQNNNNSGPAIQTNSIDMEEISPYVARVLANMPPPVQPPEDDDASKHSGEEWERRRAWGEEKRVALDKEVQRVEALLKEAKIKEAQKLAET